MTNYYLRSPIEDTAKTKTKKNGGLDVQREISNNIRLIATNIRKISDFSLKRIIFETVFHSLHTVRPGSGTHN